MKAIKSIPIFFCMVLVLGCAAGRKGTSSGISAEARSYYKQGVTLSRGNRLQEALSAFQRAVSISPQYGDAYYNMGIIDDKLGRTDEAIDAYRTAIAINPRDVQARCNLGDVLLRKHQVGYAIQELEQAVKIDPNYARAHHSLAFAYYVARLYNRAWVQLDEAKRLGYAPNPDLVKSLTAAMKPEAKE
jgi:tetratricopeptide (TPR) repeat protein